MEGRREAKLKFATERYLFSRVNGEIFVFSRATNSRFTLNSTRHTQVHIIDPLNNRLYMDFKNIHEIPHMNHMDRNCPIDIIRVVFNTKSHFDDLARPKMVFYIRDNIERQIKCVTTGDHAYDKKGFKSDLNNMETLSKTFTKLIYAGYFGLPELWLETDGRLSDFRFNPLLPEVEEFSQSVNNSDPYFWFYLMY
ncbi:unnamed protein product [Brassica rapa subsp. narinosa]